MVKRPLLLDLFCGAGGCAVGYHRAGFDVIGVDHESQPRYPFHFIKADAMVFLHNIMTEPAEENGGIEIADFAAVHASPPCQGYSRMRHLPWLKGKNYPMLIEPMRAMLDRISVPWVIENVEDAPLFGVTLCGTMFGLKVYRHRKFESNILLWQPPHHKHKVTIGSGRMLNDRCNGNADGFVSLPSKGTRLNGLRETSDHMTVAGHFAGLERAKVAMDIDWMNRAELAQAIPPAYTEYIGKQLIRAITPPSESTPTTPARPQSAP